MAIISSGGIKRDGVSREQRIQFNPKIQEIKRPANPQVRRGGSLPKKGGLDRRNSLQNNRGVAKTPEQKANAASTNSNPIKKAEQNRRPFNPKQQAASTQVNGDNPEEGTRNGVRNATPEDIANNGRISGDKLRNNPNDPNGEGLENPNELEAKDSEKEVDNPDSGAPEDDKGDEKGEPGNARRKKIWNFLKKHPMIIVYGIIILVGLFLLIFFIGIIVAIFGMAQQEGEEIKKNYGPFFAFLIRRYQLSIQQVKHL